jgi:hypothetical protein
MEFAGGKAACKSIAYVVLGVYACAQKSVRATVCDHQFSEPAAGEWLVGLSLLGGNVA